MEIFDDGIDTLHDEFDNFPIDNASDSTDSDDTPLYRPEIYRKGDDPYLTLEDMCFEWVMQESQFTGALSL